MRNGAIVLSPTKMVKTSLTPNEQCVALIRKFGDMLQEDHARAETRYFARVQRVLDAMVAGSTPPAEVAAEAEPTQTEIPMPDPPVEPLAG